MYRPDRIGPFPLATLESTPHILSAINQDVIKVQPTIEVIGVPNLATKATAVFFDSNATVNAGNQGAFGISVNGNTLHKAGEYIVAVSGTFLGWSAAEGLSVQGILGRLSASGPGVRTMSQWIHVPEMSSEFSRTSTAEVSAIKSSVNTEIVMGDFAPNATESDLDLCFGFALFNVGTGVATVQSIHASLSIHRYVEDLHTFDPNR